MEMVNIKINGMPLSVPNGISILEAARYAGIEIPTLCFLKDINEIGACRICMVEVKGARSLVTACVYPVNEGMEVFTNTEKVRNSRKITLELILSTHDRKCLSCVRSGSCELQQLCKEFGVDDETRYEGANPHYEFDDSAAHMIRDNNKCILCRRCVAACDMQKISVIGANARGFDTHISSAFDKDLADVSCISWRAVYCQLPDRRAGGKGRQRQGACRHQRSGEIRDCPDRPLYPCNPRRVLRHEHRHERAGQDGCGASPPRLR